MPAGHGVGRRFLIAGAIALACAAPAGAQAQADAYYEFLLGHYLEAQGDVRAAQTAFERAAAAAPTSGDVRAELAAFHMRQNRFAEAEKAAREALALDADNIEGHRVLGLILAGNPTRADEAIPHLERVVPTPSGATDVSLQYNLGRLYLFSGQERKAIDLLQRLVDEQPYLVQARLTLAQAQAAADRTEDAIETLLPAVASDPRLYSTLGQYYERAGRSSEAIDAYARALKANPSNRELQVRYVSALLAAPGRENAKRAVDTLAPIIEKNPKDTGALYLQSQAYRRLGDAAAAERTARTILSADAKSLSGAYALAQALGQAHRYKEVVDHIETFLSTSGRGGQETISLLTYESVAYQSLGQYDKAIAVLKKARDANPDDSTLDIYLIQAHLVAKRYAEAAAIADKARKDHPEDERLTHLHANALFHSGSPSGALALMERLVDAQPEGPDAYLMLAGLYSESGRVQDAVTVLDRAAQRFPDDRSLLFRRGSILSDAQRPVEAEQAFRQLIALEPTHADALNFLGYMFAERGERLDEAIALIGRALDGDPDNPSYLDSLGWAYFKKGDMASAEKYLSRAAAALPQNSVVQSHHGEVLSRVGRHREAAAAWTRALEGDGTDIDRPAIERKIRDARAKAR